MNDNNRKCIAVIISKPERKYQEGLLKGISNSAFARGYNVAVFATTLMEGSDEHIWGELELFNLIEFDKFAGVVYFIGSFYNSPLIDKLTNRLLEVAKNGTPVIAVDGIVKGIPNYFNDDSYAVADIINHLVDEHDVKDIAYMTGHKGHPHAEKSLQAYRNAMATLHIPVSDERIYYGDYWYTKGADFVNQLENSEKGLPEAIICANEYMAIGVYKALHAKGIYTPKHILLACTSNNSSIAPYLLTGENSLENVGYESVEKISRVLEGEELGDDTLYFPCTNHLITSVGCGCQKASAYDYSKERGVLIDTDPGYFGQQNAFRDQLYFEQDFRDLFNALDGCFDYLKDVKELHVCMCEGWNQPSFIIKDFKKNDYTDKIYHVYSHIEKENGPETTYDETVSFPRSEVFPVLFKNEGEPSLYTFRSLHFLDRNYGYIVLNCGQSTKVYDYTFNFWLHDFVNGIESACRIQSINYMFYTDIMTGIYNRNGFNTLVNVELQNAKKQDKQVLIALADMNFLKHINDTYGHEEGDIAIKSGASLLAAQKVPGALSEMNFRMGGDEFVKIAVGDFIASDIESFKKDLYANVDEFSKNSGKPYKIQFSVGICVDKIYSMDEMESYYSKVDQQMYEEKVRMKGNRQN